MPCRVVLALAALALAQQVSAGDPDDKEKEKTTYQQMGVGEQGKPVGGGCVNWDDIRMNSVSHSAGGREWKGILGGKKSLDECAKEVESGRASWVERSLWT